MKTKDEIVGPARAAIALLAFATAIIPVLAVEKSGAVATEHSDAIRPFHVNMPATVPAEVAKALRYGDPPPSGLSVDERHAWDQLDF